LVLVHVQDALQELFQEKVLQVVLHVQLDNILMQGLLLVIFVWKEHIQLKVQINAKLALQELIL
jgi:hypothetical protein